jgi:hypothetical protein
MEQTMLGTRPPLPLCIDAVHVAVKSMECKVAELVPGAHVNKDGYPRGNTVGIVDPFLRIPVKLGDYFYLCLYPGTITALRHYWTHPAFQPEESAKNSSLTWMEKFTREVLDCECSEFMVRLDEVANDPGARHVSTYGDHQDDLREAWPEICFHYGNISGRKINPSDYVSFTCVC